MGPPKRRPKKTSVSELKRRYDCFEYRWNTESHSYYMFNPWTGETIFEVNADITNRSFSMWAVPDKFPSHNAQTIMLYPEFYASRRWGRRPFNGWESEEAASTHINAVARGFLARQLLRAIFRQRFHTMVDPFSGYLFYVDTANPTEDTTWYKPRLAFPGDIVMFKEEDPEDYLKGFKFSRQDFKIGPYMTVSGLNKAEKARTKIEAFIVQNNWRDLAVGHYRDIDLSTAPIGTIISWMEDGRSAELTLSSFNTMRVALETGGWETTMEYMKAFPDDIVIQLYGFHNFAKTEVPIDVSGVLDYTAYEAMSMCVGIVKDENNDIPPQLKVFALEAFHNILSVRPGRLEYLNTSLVPEQGALRDAAVERFLTARFNIFSRYLTMIPTETFSVFSKGAAVPEIIKKPVPRIVEVLESIMKCLCALAQEIESKEQLAFTLVQPLLFALQCCQEEAYLTMLGLKLMYNLCYRCESGQEAILAFLNPLEFFPRVRQYHSGDFDVMRQCRRFELALKKDGWRGNVETLLTREMQNEEIDDEFLQPSEYSNSHK